MGETGKRRFPWLRVAFGLSLALNLLVAGLAVGAMLRFGGHDHKRGGPPSVGTALYRALPDTQRKDLRKETKGLLEGRRGARAQDLKAVIATLEAQPFDAQALRGLITGQAERRNAQFLKVQNAWLERVLAMDEAERLAYAQRLQDVAERKRSKRNKH